MVTQPFETSSFGTEGTCIFMLGSLIKDNMSKRTDFRGFRLGAKTLPSNVDTGVPREITFRCGRLRYPLEGGSFELPVEMFLPLGANWGYHAKVLHPFCMTVLRLYFCRPELSICIRSYRFIRDLRFQDT